MKFFCQTPAIADIVILVDGSWSIGRFNFRLVRLFLENLVTAFDVGSEKTRIGTSSVVSSSQMSVPNVQGASEFSKTLNVKCGFLNYRFDYSDATRSASLDQKIFTPTNFCL